MMYQAAAEGGAGTGRVRSASQHGHGYARSEAWEAFGLDGRTQKSTKDGVVSTPYYLELDLGDVEDVSQQLSLDSVWFYLARCK